MDQLPPLGNAPLKQAPEVDTEIPGFVGNGVACGLKKNGKSDLALICAKKPVPVAGVFTSNKLVAAPVVVCRRHVAAGRARAVLVNSGNANAATGRAGLDACEQTCRAAAKALGCRESEVMPCSTGVIGQLLDAEKIEAAMPGLAAGLGPGGLTDAAEAMMTTDAFRKMARRQAVIGDKPVSVLGMCKGAGMIRPDMATMLCFILTDAAVSAQALAGVLAGAVEASFNRATVEGDTSTNDTALIMASGEAGNPELTPGDPDLAWFAGAVTAVCQELAAMVVADGEGAGHLVRVRITGAEDDDQARALAYAVALSPLVKTAFAGMDPNWGRILCAAGAEASRAGLSFEPEKSTLYIGGAAIARGGIYGGSEAEERAAKVMAGPRYEVQLDLGLKSGEFWLLTSDLDHEYIKINADYRS